MSAREQRHILTELGLLKNQVVRLETKVDILQQTTPPQQSTPILPGIGGAIGLIAGTILTWQQFTGKA